MLESPRLTHKTMRSKLFDLFRKEMDSLNFPDVLIRIIYEYTSNDISIHEPIISDPFFCDDMCSMRRADYSIVSPGRIIACSSLTCLTTCRSTICCCSFPLFWCASTFNLFCGIEIPHCLAGDIVCNPRDCYGSCLTCLLSCLFQGFHEGEIFIENGCTCFPSLSGRHDYQCPDAFTCGFKMFATEEVSPEQQRML